MRKKLFALAALALAACDGGVPPPGQEPLRASSPDNASDEVQLRTDGLAAGVERFYFAAGRNEVDGALTRVIGEPFATASNDECGAGALEMTRFRGGLMVNYERGYLVGWIFERDERGSSPSISVAGDVQLGAALAEAEAVDGFKLIENSTLGTEFTLGDKMGGLVGEDGKVSALYSGKQCFFR
ncbi:MAG: aspartate-semialdehyde dehydrogenase [Pseudomonadota bacterium]